MRAVLAAPLYLFPNLFVNEISLLTLGPICCVILPLLTRVPIPALPLGAVGSWTSVFVALGLRDHQLPSRALSRIG